MSTVAELAVNLVANTGDFNRTMKQLGNQLKTTGRTIQDLGKSFALLSVPILGFGAYSVKAATEFESAFAGVKKTVDASPEGFAKLEAGIKSLAERIPATTTEIAKVAEAAGQLGIKNDAILGFTETMINMGETTNLSSDRAAEALAQFANVTQMSQQDFGKLGAVIVGLGNDSAATESAIVEMASRIAAAGSAVKLSEAQIIALATAVSSVGIEAEAGGSAISQGLIKMQKAVLDGGEALQNFAAVSRRSAEEFAETFKTAPDVAIQAFIKGLQNIQAEGGNVFAALEKTTGAGIRSVQAFTSLALAGDLLNKYLQNSGPLWEKEAALTEEANKRYETFASQIQLTQNKFKNLAIDIGNVLVPTLQALNKLLQQTIEWFRAMPAETKTTIVIIGALVGAVAPLTVALGFLIGSVGTLVKTLPMLKKELEAMKAVSAVLAGAGGILGAVSALGLFAFAVDRLVKSIIGLMEELDPLIGKMKEVANWTTETRNANAQLASAGLPAVEQRLKTLNATYDKYAKMMKQANELGMQSHGGYQKLAEKLSQVKTQISTLEKTRESLTAAEKEGVKTGKDLSGTAGDVAKQMEAYTAAQKDAKQAQKDAEAEAQKLTDSMAELKDELLGVKDDALKDFKTKLDELFAANPGKSAKDLAEDISKIGQAAIQSGVSVGELSEAAKEGGEGASTDFLGGLFDPDQWEKQSGEMLEGLNEQLGKDLEAGLSDVFQGLADGGSVRASVQKLGGSIGSTLGQSIGSAFGPIGAMVGQALGDVLGDKVGGIISKIGQSSKKSWEGLGLILGGATGFGIAAGLAKAFGGESDPFANAREQAAGMFNEAIQKAQELGYQMERFETFGRDAFDQITNSAGESTTRITEMFNTLTAEQQANFSNLGYALGSIFQIENLESGQFGQMLAANFGMGLNSLNDLQILLVTMGYTAEQVAEQLESAFLRGDLTAKQFLASSAAIEDLFAKGIPGATAATSEAFQNFRDDALVSGAEALDALGDIGAEAMEKLDASGSRAINSLEDLRAELINSGHSVEDVDKFMEALAANGINSLEDLSNVTAKQAASIVSSLQDASFGFREVGEDIDALKAKLDAIQSKEIDIKVNVNYEHHGEPPPSGDVTVSKKGNIFANGQLMRFAQGGVIDRPMFFPLQRGFGLAGEAGAEAILPLKRTAQGDLGVSAQNIRQGDNITITIDAKGAELGVEQRIKTVVENYFERRNRLAGQRA